MQRPGQASAGPGGPGMRPLGLWCFLSPRPGGSNFSFLSFVTRHGQGLLPDGFFQQAFMARLPQNQYQALTALTTPPSEMLLSRGTGPHLGRHDTTQTGTATCWEGTLALHLQINSFVRRVWGAVHPLATEAEAPTPLDFRAGNLANASTAPGGAGRPATPYTWLMSPGGKRTTRGLVAIEAHSDRV